MTRPLETRGRMADKKRAPRGCMKSSLTLCHAAPAVNQLFLRKLYRARTDSVRGGMTCVPPNTDSML